jgi:hypothetical protein
MALYTRTRRILPVKGVNGAAPALGDTDKVTFRVDPQPRHLARVTFVAKLTAAGATVAPTANKDAFEGVIKHVQVILNDSTSGRRTAIDAPGSSLIHWADRKGVSYDRHTRRSLNPTSAGTYYVATPVWFEDPSLPDLVSAKTALPLYDAGDRPKINEPVEIRLTMGAAGLNLSQGTVTLDSIVAVVEFLENVGPAVPYVPTSLLKTTWGPFTANGIPQEFLVEKDGYLGSLLLEGYSAYTTGTGGSALQAGQRFLVKQDNVDLDEFDDLTSVIEDDQYHDESTFTATGPRGLVGPIVMRDYLHNSPQNNGHVPFSMPRVWADSSRVRITSSGVAQNAAVDVTVHKFLTADAQVLVGI